MKRLLSVVLAIIVVFASLAGTASAASGGTDIKVKLNGEWVIFPAPPVLQNGKTYVEFRTLFTQLGYSIDYNASTKLIKAKSAARSIEMKPSGKTALVDGKNVPVNGEMKLLNGRTMVGVRFIATLSDKTVNWDGVKKIVTITDKGPTAQQQAEVFGVLDKLTAAEDAQDAAAYMAVFHAESPVRDLIRESVQETFAKVHTKTTFSEKTIDSYSPVEAVVYTVEQSVKVGGDGFFADVENEMLYTLHKENGKWAIYDAEQLSHQLLDLDGIWNEAIAAPEADKTAISALIAANAAAVNAKDLNAYKATLVPGAEGFDEDVNSMDELFKDTETSLKMNLEKNAIVELNGDKALLLTLHTFEVTIGGEMMPVKSINLYNLKKVDNKWLLMPGSNELYNDMDESEE
ncbi:copper amine oxidase N-terminal domain-containing protein [Paenibacillus sp. CF384]|uniref:copper amine oxidase N-terminal domain-containing protein n=1 Tax=Paenibacillus sp. CF384 TaxID=1884382 RepID=UPI00089A87F3|nr:copper amine oxidase N-terminal domain-containing protein [Paenibacillus sp. CF384]SDX60579.1 Copper amine oxidase N-terminal domain-containing protein [Paenibacillus sp. CF384]